MGAEELKTYKTNIYFLEWQVLQLQFRLNFAWEKRFCNDSKQ